MNKYRGHEIIEKNGKWFYKDNNVLVGDFPNRPCGLCGKENTFKGHDACIADLPNVINACCGHGNTEDAYVMFEDGSRIGGEDAISFLKSVGKTIDNPL